MTSNPETAPAIVRVDLSVRGAWEVAPASDDRFICATLHEAETIAHRWAGDHCPCELVIRDAYHRVVRRELVTR